MYAVVRTYSGQGASDLLDLLGQREEDVKALISGVPGFVTYAAVRNGDGGVTMTVCDDKAGADESSRRASEWVSENLGADGQRAGDHRGDTSPAVQLVSATTTYPPSLTIATRGEAQVGRAVAAVDTGYPLAVPGDSSA